jgi:hypothetical protein
MKFVTALFLLLPIVGLSATTPIQFDQIKALAGDWQAKLPDGKTLDITYIPISGGTAVMEVLNMPDGTDMRSIYHLNGENLMMTHYCESGNQPRLESTPSSDPNNFTLSFVDASNIGNPEQSSYLYKVTFHFKDKDSFSQDITWMINGKESTNTWYLVRTK